MSEAAFGAATGTLTAINDGIALMEKIGGNLSFTSYGATSISDDVKIQQDAVAVPAEATFVLGATVTVTAKGGTRKVKVKQGVFGAFKAFCLVTVSVRRVHGSNNKAHIGHLDVSLASGEHSGMSGVFKTSSITFHTRPVSNSGSSGLELKLLLQSKSVGIEDITVASIELYGDGTVANAIGSFKQALTGRLTSKAPPVSELTKLAIAEGVVGTSERKRDVELRRYVESTHLNLKERYGNGTYTSCRPDGGSALELSEAEMDFVRQAAASHDINKLQGLFDQREKNRLVHFRQWIKDHMVANAHIRGIDDELRRLIAENLDDEAVRRGLGQYRLSDKGLEKLQEEQMPLYENWIKQNKPEGATDADVQTARELAREAIFRRDKPAQVVEELQQHFDEVGERVRKAQEEEELL